MPAAVLLHGFAGTARHWEAVASALPPGGLEPLAVELARVDPVTPDGVAALVAAHAPERFVLAGYSMGARLALHVARAMPARVARLVLVSASAGIEDAAARAGRRAADETLADEIERRGIGWFVEHWGAVPLFAQDPAWIAEAVAADERRCTAAQLAASLRGLGPGAMTPLWRRLGARALPGGGVGGARDRRYVAGGRRPAAGIGRGTSFEVVPGVGHRLALEAPDAVARALDG